MAGALEKTMRTTPDRVLLHNTGRAHPKKNKCPGFFDFTDSQWIYVHLPPPLCVQREMTHERKGKNEQPTVHRQNAASKGRVRAVPDVSFAAHGTVASTKAGLSD